MAKVDTQISLAVPVGTYGRVAPRSGLGTCYFSTDYTSFPFISNLVLILIFQHLSL